MTVLAISIYCSRIMLNRASVLIPPVFLTDFPPEMASLAKTRVDEEGELVAARFELYIEGLELANAYDELIDADVLTQSF